MTKRIPQGVASIVAGLAEAGAAMTIKPLRIIAFLVVVSACVAATDAERTACYPASREYRHGDLTISVKQWAETEEHLRNPLSYKDGARLTIRNGTRVLRQIQYSAGELEPLGNLSGLFVPAVQPSRRFFSIIKYFSYDARHLLIDRDGTVIDLPGGKFFVVKVEGRALMFVIHMTDGQGPVTVFDLKSGKSVVTLKLPIYVTDAFTSENDVYLRGPSLKNPAGEAPKAWVCVDGRNFESEYRPLILPAEMKRLPIVDGYETLRP